MNEWKGKGCKESEKNSGKIEWMKEMKALLQFTV